MKAEGEYQKAEIRKQKGEVGGRRIPQARDGG
jgi:hypothetical protein